MKVHNQRSPLGTSSETSQLKKQIKELQKRIANLQTRRRGSSSSQQRPFICRNCGKKVHLAQNHRQDKVGDGLTFHPKHKSQTSQTRRDEEESGNLNQWAQGKGRQFPWKPKFCLVHLKSQLVASCSFGSQQQGTIHQYQQFVMEEQKLPS